MSKAKEFEQRLERTEHQLGLLQKISRCMVRDMRLQDALNRVVTLVVEFMECDSCLIYVVDGNYRNRGELLLRHEYNGLDLKLDRAADTLGNVQAIWGRPVHLQTVVEDKPTLMSYDGTEHSIRNLGDADDPRKHATGKTK